MEWQRTKGRELLAEASKNKETGEVTNEEVCIFVNLCKGSVILNRGIKRY